MALPAFLKPVVAVNLALLLFYPIAWIAPLAHAGVLPFFSGTQITVVGGVRELWQADATLAILVAVFAVVIPYGKTIFLSLVHFGLAGPRALGVIEIIAKLSMADVFLIALYIVLVKGVGVGHVGSGWGLWLFTACVLTSIWVGFETKRKIGEWT